MNLAVARAFLHNRETGVLLREFVQGGFGMEDCTVADVIGSDHPQYRSRKGALIWFFRKSRNLWKAKYKVAKSEESKLRKKVAYLDKAREQDLADSTQLRRALEETRAQNKILRASLESNGADEKKDCRDKACTW